MYVLDTDVLGFYLNNPNQYPYLRDNILSADAKGLLCTTVITVEEMMGGLIDEIRKGATQKSEKKIIEAYKVFDRAARRFEAVYYPTL